MPYKNKLLNFINDTAGNVAMMTALMLPVLLVGIGAAVTISDATSKKAKLQMHADAMSLAMAKINNFESKRKAEEYYDNYIANQLDEDATCTQKLDDNPSRATIKCSGEVTSLFAGLMQKKVVPYTVESKALVSTKSTFEVSFVFDVSLSMEGAELAELQSGLKLVTESALFDDKDSRLSLLPFANTVRLGPEFESFVEPVNGYTAAGGVYNGCFDRIATDPSVDLTTDPKFPLVRNSLNSGKVVCPHQSMTALFHKEATDWDVIDMTKQLDTSFGTGMSDGLVWAFRSLDPSLRGVLSSSSSYPLNSFDQSSKHIFMLTDGEPYDRPWTGPGGGQATRDASLLRFEEVCNALPFAAKDIHFHLINYNNKSLSPAQLSVFENCVAGDGKFYSIDAGGLEEVLSKITEHVSGLRLTQ